MGRRALATGVLSLSLTVVRERPSRRRAYGINAPLFVSVAGGGRVRAREWSHLGLVLSDDALPPLDGGTVHIALHLNFQGYDIAVPARAKLDLTGDSPTPDGCTRLEFVDLPQRSVELIEHFVEDYVRGRLVPAADTLVRIDTPAEPISTKPDPPKPGEPEPRFSIRPYLTTLFYLALGLGVFAYIGLLLYANIWRMEVTTAVVTRPIEVVKMRDHGTVASIEVKPNEVVAPGAVIARLSNPELEERIERAEAVVETAKSATRRARKRLAINERRMQEYRILGRAAQRRVESDLRKARSDWLKAVKRLRDVVALGDSNAAGIGKKDVRKGALGWAWNEGEWGHACEGALKPREWADLVALRTMFPHADTIRLHRRKDLVPCAVLVNLYRNQARLREQLKKAETDAKRQRRVENVSNARLYNGREFIVDLDIAKLDKDKAKAREKEAKAVLTALERTRERNELRAARPGRVVDVSAAPSLSLSRGDPVAVIEADVPAVVEAYLNQEEIEVARMGDPVQLFLTALERHVPGRIVRIDRTSGFVDEQRSQYIWRGPEDRSGRVLITFDDEAFADEVASGLPVTVLFRRHSTSAATASAWNGVSDATGSAWSWMGDSLAWVRDGTQAYIGGGAAPGAVQIP